MTCNNRSFPRLPLLATIYFLALVFGSTEVRGQDTTINNNQGYKEESIVKFDTSLVGLKLELRSEEHISPTYTKTKTIYTQNGGTQLESHERGGARSRNDYVYFGQTGKYCNARNRKLLNQYFAHVPEAQRIYGRYLFQSRMNLYGAIGFLGGMIAGATVDPDFQLHSNYSDRLAPLKISLIILSGVSLVSARILYYTNRGSIEGAIKVYNDTIVKYGRASLGTFNFLQEHGTYMNLGLGYGYSMQYKKFEDEILAGLIEEVNGSMGKGVNLDGRFGYMFNKKLKAELGINYLFGGGKIKSSNGGTPVIYRWRASMIRFIPTVVVTLGRRYVHPYVKAGLVFGLAPNVSRDSITGYTHNPTIMEIRKRYQGGVPIGFASALGANIGGGKRYFFAELGMISQSYAPKKMLVTKATINGQNQLSSMTVSQKETDFVDSNFSSVTSNPNVPTQATKVHFPFSSFGINIGMHFSLRRGK